MDGLRITLADVKSAKVFTPDGKGYCVNGMREFAKQNGLSLGEFVRQGIPYERFRQFEQDAMVKPVIDAARRRSGI